MFTVYGIKNCDSVKKALNMLEQNAAHYQFVDFKKEGLSADKVTAWKKFLGQWPINKRGTTFRKIKDQWEMASEQERLMLIVNNSSLIKRPVLEDGKGNIHFGFDPELYQSLS